MLAIVLLIQASVITVTLANQRSVELGQDNMKHEPRSIHMTKETSSSNAYRYIYPQYLYKNNHAKFNIYRHPKKHSKIQTGVLYSSNQYPSNQPKNSQYQWSRWSEWSLCSAVCGGGVRKRARKCLRNSTENKRKSTERPGNELCGNGNEVDYQECNKQICWSNKELKRKKHIARKKQCYEKRNVPFGGKMYEWFPYTRAGLNECFLNCIPYGLRIFKSFGNVIDGTICGDKQGFACYQGKCLKRKTSVANNTKEKEGKFVSNWSKKKLAMKKITEIFQTKRNELNGYKEAFVIPQSASRISIWNLYPSKNRIGLKEEESYILNGGYNFSPSRKFYFDGITISYLVKKKKSKYLEQIYIDGPLPYNITVEIIFQGDSSKVKYSYIFEKNTSTYKNEIMKDFPIQNYRKRNFSKRAGILQPPKVSTNPQLQIYSKYFSPKLSKTVPSQTVSQRVYNNIQIQTGVTKVPKYFQLSRKPYLTNQNSQKFPHQKKIHWNGQPSPRSNYGYRVLPKHQANNFESIVSSSELKEGHRSKVMTYKWQIGGITRCTKRCNTGEQQFIYKCFELTNSESGKFVEESLCRHLEPPVKRKRVCNTQPCPTRWVVGSWSECSYTCGNSSVKTRPVICKESYREKFTVVERPVNPRSCIKLKKPESVKQCSVVPCSFKWRTEPWGTCSATCDKGIQVRNVYCVHHYGNRISNGKCNPSERPADMRECFLTHCNVVWMTGAWGKCSGSCGKSIQRRNIICADPFGGKHSNERCHKDALGGQPKSTQPCVNEQCTHASWMSSQWSKCSSDCGMGHRYRQVYCITYSNENGVSRVNDGNCNDDIKPISTVACRGDKCQGNWFVTRWFECNVSCGNGTKFRRRFCLDQNFKPSKNCSVENQPIVWKKCLNQPCTQYPYFLKSAKRTILPNVTPVTKMFQHPNTAVTRSTVSSTFKLKSSFPTVTSNHKDIISVNSAHTTSNHKAELQRSSSMTLHSMRKKILTTAMTTVSTTKKALSLSNKRPPNQIFRGKNFNNRRKFLHNFPFAKLSKEKCFINLQSRAYCDIIANKLRFCNKQRFYSLCCRSCENAASKP